MTGTTLRRLAAFLNALWLVAIFVPADDADLSELLFKVLLVMQLLVPVISIVAVLLPTPTRSDARKLTRHQPINPPRPINAGATR